MIATRVPIMGPSTVISEKMPAVCGLPKVVLGVLVAMMYGRAAIRPAQRSGRLCGGDEEVKCRWRGGEAAQAAVFGVKAEHALQLRDFTTQSCSGKGWRNERRLQVSD